MARIKTVYSPDMVCHLWANRHAHNVRNATANIYNEGGTLYSYGRHHAIATFLDNPAEGGTPAILWNDNTYGKTTARHHNAAWHALSTAQRAIVIRVPDMRGDISKDTAALDSMAAVCIKAAVLPLEKSDKARQARDAYISAAAAWFNRARSIYTYTGNKKAAAAVPVIPENADKGAIKAVLLGINKAEYIAAAVRFMERSTQHYSNAEYIAQCGNARTACRAAVDSENTAKQAGAQYKQAGVKVPAVVNAAIKRAAAFIVTHTPAARAETIKELKTTIEDTNREVLRALATKKRGPFNRTLASGRVITRSHSTQNFNYSIERLTWPAQSEYAELWTNPTERAAQSEYWSNLFSRVQRVRAAGLLESAIKSAENTAAEYARLTSTEHSFYSVTVPSGRHILNALQVYTRAAGVYTSEFLSAHAWRVADNMDLIAKEYAAKAAERNAAKLAEWRAGGRVSVPRDIPPMVRIVGDILETSHGASVPVSHAVRLVEIARKAAARGGADFERGTGPKVGHFTLTHIGADMSAIIGCHTFTSEEGKHAAALIDAWVIKNLQGALLAKAGE